MFRNPEEDIKKLGKVSINCLIGEGGIGDMIGAFPAIKYILDQYPWVNLLIWVPDFIVPFARNVLPSTAVVRGYSDAPKKYDNTRTGITTKWDKRTSPMKTHAVDYSFSVLCDENPAIEHKNYLKVDTTQVDITRFNLPAKYVVMQATAAEKVKTMPEATANAITDYVVSKGYIPVYLGKRNNKSGIKGIENNATESPIDKSKGIDLVDQTSMLETIAIIAGAKCIVCMDGGTLHMAGCTDTPIVAGYTFIDPSHNLPIRHNKLGWNCHVVTPTQSLGCRFCQSKINYVYGLDFRSCFYKDYKCLDHMTASKFIKLLEKIL